MNQDAETWRREHEITVEVARALDGKKSRWSKGEKNSLAIWGIILTIAAAANVIGFLQYVPLPKIAEDPGIMIAEKPIPETQLPTIAESSAPRSGRTAKTFSTLPKATPVHTPPKVRAVSAIVDGVDVTEH